MASPLAAKAKAADKPKANGNKDKWPQLLRGYEGFSCREADKKGKVIIKPDSSSSSIIYDPFAENKAEACIARSSTSLWRRCKCQLRRRSL